MEATPRDLDRLIDAITDEILARLNESPAARPSARESVAQLIDHTLLRPDATDLEIDRLCDEAKTHGFATVCVNAIWVERCVKRLGGSSVKTCCVVGFPFGATLPEVKALEASRARELGAAEIDMVIAIGLLKSGRFDDVERDILGVVRAGGRPGVTKVILETCLLTDEEKRVACRLAVNAGADYVKTSTGFSSGGATAKDVALMRAEVGSRMGVKASGGVRDRATLEHLVAAGATRIGASASVKIVKEQG